MCLCEGLGSIPTTGKKRNEKKKKLIEKSQKQSFSTEVYVL
jgi:hypothetical protein